MRFVTALLSCLFMALCFSSCGKKPESKEKTKEELTNQPVDLVYFNALNDAKASLASNNSELFIKTIDENPTIDINMTLDDGNTLLTSAILNDYVEIRNYLIKKGAKLEKTDTDKRTPLIVAVANNKFNTVKILVELKVDLDKKDKFGSTALHTAINYELDDIGVYLITKGANIDSVDSTDKNCFKLATEKSVPNTLEMIRSILQIESGAPDLTSFRTILLQGDVKRVDALLASYPKIATDTDYQSINPLALILDLKDENIALRLAMILLDAQANPNGPTSGEVPLIKATTSKKMNFIKLYLSKGANPNTTDSKHKSGLIYAVEMNDYEYVDLFLRFNALKEYEFTNAEGKKKKYKACDVVRDARKYLRTKEELTRNTAIKDRLDCGLFRRIVQAENLEQ